MCKFGAMHCNIGENHRHIWKEMFGGAKGVDIYWIVNACNVDRACISPGKFITHNGEHSFLFVATYSLSELYT